MGRTGSSKSILNREIKQKLSLIILYPKRWLMKFKETLCLGPQDSFLIRVETIYRYIFDPS